MEGYVLASFQAASAAILNIERDTLGSKSLSLTTNSDQTDKNRPRKQAALPEAVEPPATDRGSGPQAAEERVLDETRSTTQVAASPQQSTLRNGLMRAGKRPPRCYRSPPPFVETQSFVDEHPVGIVKEQTDKNDGDGDDEEDEADWMFVSAPVAPASNGTTSIGSNNSLKSTKLLIDFSSDDEGEDNTTEPHNEIMASGASPSAPDKHEDCDDENDEDLLEKSSHQQQQAEEEEDTTCPEQITELKEI